MRLAPTFIAALFLAAAGCYVEATPAPGSGGDTGGGGPDAATGNPGDDPDAAPGTPTGDGGETPTAQSVLTDFGNCMRIADWEAANLGQLALTQTAEGPCSDCHGAGQNGNYLNADSLLTFDNIKTYPYILKYATADAQLVISQNDILVVKGQQGGHPAYTLPADLIQGLTDFYDATMIHYQANDCPPAL